MRSRVIGRYVYILDDDDFLVYPHFIRDLKAICDEHEPDVVICKGHINGNVLPSLPVYDRKHPIRGCIGSPNFVVSNELFQGFSVYWTREMNKDSRAGDFHFINAIFNQYKPDVYWEWDQLVFKAGIGNGQPGDYK